MQCGNNTSLMDISEDLFSESLIIVVASELNLSLFPHSLFPYPYDHLEAGCIVLSNSEYQTRQNRALMILAVTWVKEHKLVGAETVWYKERWERGMVLEHDKAKLVWYFQFNLRKTETARRPGLILERKYEKIWICYMHVPCNKILIRNGEISLRDIDSLFLR